MPVGASSHGSGPGGSARDAQFAFKGTVARVKATTMADLPADARTVAVRVDEVLKAPEAMQHLTGQEITLRLAPGEKVRAGESAVFYANGWRFGESIAV